MRKILLLLLAMYAFFYLLFAFSYLDINPAAWAKEARNFLAIIYTILLFLAFCVVAGMNTNSND
jgi:succinate dehydrogenase hydrophobic anchor subunit